MTLAYPQYRYDSTLNKHFVTFKKYINLTGELFYLIILNEPLKKIPICRFHRIPIIKKRDAKGSLRNYCVKCKRYKRAKDIKFSTKQQLQILEIVTKIDDLVGETWDIAFYSGSSEVKMGSEQEKRMFELAESVRLLIEALMDDNPD